MCKRYTLLIMFYAKLIQTFSDLYSSYCDCGKFIKWLDESKYLNKDSDAMDIDESPQDNNYAYFITRGAELCDVSDGVCKLGCVYD